MTDDKNKRDRRDRAQVAAGETYEVDYFAEKHGISREEAQALIDRVGNSREKLESAVAQGKGSRRAARPRAATRARTSKSGGTAAKRTRSTSSATKAAALVAPVAEAATAAKRGAGRAVTTARRRTAAVGASAAKVPAAAKRRAATAAESVKSAATGRTAALVGAAAAGLAAGLAVNIGRKAIVQAPTALAGDWLEGLKTEHKLALAIFDQLQATTVSDTGKRSVLLTQLKHALGKHAFTEENVIYPALREWGDKADADKLNHDHGYVKQYLYELDGMPNDAPGFLRKVVDFRADLEAHIREEEDAIFPPLHAALGEDRNAKVTALANKEGFKLA